MGWTMEKPTTSPPPANNEKPPVDMVLRLAVLILVLCFAYLFLEVFYPVKQASAVISFISGIIGFYFGAMYGQNTKPQA